MTDSPPYMIADTVYLPLVSARFMEPAMVHIPLLVAGMSLTPSEEEQAALFTLLRDALVAALDGHVNGVGDLPMYFQPYAHKLPDAPTLRYRIIKGFTKVDTMTPHDTPTFLKAIVVCFLLALGLAGAALYALTGPFLSFM